MVANQANDHFFVATQFRFTGAHDLDLPTLAFRVPGVHSKQVACEQRGFVTTGLWKYSRHPNFAAEQAIWVLFYQWGCFASGSMYNWTAVGMIGYLLVFQGSTPLTEEISASKYPEYRLFQERVGKFVPTLFSRGWNEEEAIKLRPKYVEQAKKEAEKKKK